MHTKVAKKCQKVPISAKLVNSGQKVTESAKQVKKMPKWQKMTWIPDFIKKDALYLVTLKYTHSSLKCTKQMTDEGMFAA